MFLSLILSSFLLPFFSLAYPLKDAQRKVNKWEQTPFFIFLFFLTFLSTTKQTTCRKAPLCELHWIQRKEQFAWQFLELLTFSFKGSKTKAKVNSQSRSVLSWENPIYQFCIQRIFFKIENRKSPKFHNCHCVLAGIRNSPQQLKLLCWRLLIQYLSEAFFKHLREEMSEREMSEITTVEHATSCELLSLTCFWRE